jgi:hypothetical protein
MTKIAEFTRRLECVLYGWALALPPGTRAVPDQLIGSEDARTRQMDARTSDGGPLKMRGEDAKRLAESEAALGSRDRTIA